jgi:hypothetical protein
VSEIPKIVSPTGRLLTVTRKVGPISERKSGELEETISEMIVEFLTRGRGGFMAMKDGLGGEVTRVKAENTGTGKTRAESQ